MKSKNKIHAAKKQNWRRPCTPENAPKTRTKISRAYSLTISNPFSRTEFKTTELMESDLLPPSFLRDSTEDESTCLVNMIGFSKPMTMTKNGRPSERRMTSIGTPSDLVTQMARKKAKVEESKVAKVSQNFDPSLLMEKSKLMK